MTVATDAVFEMPEDGENEGPRLSEENDANISDPEAGGASDRVDEDNVPHPGLNLDGSSSS